MKLYTELHGLRVLLENLAVSQQVKKFPIALGNRKIITVLAIDSKTLS
jgi:hypothetical protein